MADFSDLFAKRDSERAAREQRAREQRRLMEEAARASSEFISEVADHALRDAAESLRRGGIPAHCDGIQGSAASMFIDVTLEPG